MIYHKGLLMLDRLSNKTLDRKARQLYKLAREGKVLLTQRRVKKNVCEYHATEPISNDWWGENAGG